LETTFDKAFRNSLTGVESGYRVYIAGPITGDLLGNLPRFFEAEDVLRAAGHTTFNPARLDGGRTPRECIEIALERCGRKTWTEYMQQGIRGLMRCNAIATLPEWWTSKGANIEQTLAAQLGYAGFDSRTGNLVHDTGIRTDNMPGELIG
jgi:hypothetical protein